jgi:hypothetical protein
MGGDALAWPLEAAQLLDVDVHELTRRRALVADDLLARRSPLQPRATVPAKHRMHGRGRDAERPADQVRPFAELGSRS